MSCSRCPHHVRHGKFDKEEQTIVFSDLCGLLIKRTQDPEAIKPKVRGRGRPASQEGRLPRLPEGTSLECSQAPFPESDFDYFMCPTYQDNFKSSGSKHNVVPTKDFQYSERLSSNSITEMDLL
ncbi:hypothetical protein N9W79_02180 [bacterium]|nr:hypothetical protein [bacterium]